jgi:hypothetical protein
MILAKPMARSYKTLIVQASLAIITYDRQAIFEVKATVGFRNNNVQQSVIQINAILHLVMAPPKLLHHSPILFSHQIVTIKNKEF